MHLLVRSREEIKDLQCGVVLRHLHLRVRVKTVNALRQCGIPLVERHKTEVECTSDWCDNSGPGDWPGVYEVDNSGLR